MLSDIRHAFRQLLKAPGYTAVVVFTLALGIAVNTQIFAMVSAFFLQPMPVREPGRLVALVQRSDVINLPYQLSFPDFQDIRAGSRALGDHIAFTSTAAHLSVPGQSPERIWIEAVTPDAFGKLGVGVALGRPLQPADGDTAPGQPVTVITHRFWTTHLGQDPAVIGRSLLINGKSFTVVGVAQPGFESFSYWLSVGAFVPSGAISQLRNDADAVFKYRGMSLWNVLSYLRPGATLTEANAELGVFARRFAHDFPDSHRNTRLQAVFEQRARPAPTLTDFAPLFAALFAGLVALVLFIACANVANLMGARALNREREFVVRAALGATRGRLIRQLLVESVVLALLAGAVGFVLAEWSGTLFAGFVPQRDFPVRALDGADWRVAVFTVAVSLLAGLGSGLFPALRSSRVNLHEGLKRHAGQQPATTRHRGRNLLVVGQVALSCVVLISAALFLRGLQTSRRLALGFRSDNILMLSLDLSLQGYDRPHGLRFQQEVLDRVRALPGVVSADFSQHVPFGNTMVFRDTWPDAPTGPLPDGHTTVALSAVTPGFVTHFGIPLLRGRDLTPSDDENAPHVAVINEAMARAFWPGRDPLGQHFHRDWRGGPAIEVVGGVATGRYIMLTEEPKPYYYVPMAQYYGMPATLVVRAHRAPQALAQSLRDIVRAVDADLPIYSLVTFDEHMASSALAFLPLRMGAMLAGFQGVLGLLLAVLGLYAVVSYDVNSRTREIGVRLALGAAPADVLRLVSREGLRLTVLGLVIGLALALLLGFGLSRILFGVPPVDPIAFPAVILLLCATAALACWLPARRATRIDPLAALRTE